ncbi:MAG: beta-propeller fold lactonase family protein [Silvibacterium sp.]|nr:beta-propeller fold lactonase family protein [Silvibacterium sp.]MBV8436500.1 beta-propeller fold lactonase family protein [Silvibacterium sp.]
MKFKKFGRVTLALVVSLGLGFGITSCSTDFTAAFLYVTGTQYNQIGAFQVLNNTGNLRVVNGSPYGSGGTNPIRSLVSSTGRYLYVLNNGSPSADSSGNITYSGENISIFSIGGGGNLAFQQSYTSQGTGSIRMGFNSTGSYLYVLDEYMPQKNAAGQIVNASSSQSTAFPCPDPSAPGIWRPVGAITAFSVDTNTGRLSLITNNQQTDSSGAQLTTFPVGCFPIDIKVSAGFIFVPDNGPAPGSNNTLFQSVFVYALNATNGQLTLTQNSELPTGAKQISTIGSDQANKYIYILDTGDNQIFYYTIGTSGLLQAVTGSPTPNVPASAVNPVALTSDSKGKFLYIANAGPSSGTTNPNSQITAYTIQANGVLAPIASPNPITTGSGPQCIIEDPSNQYIYTADSISNTVTGHVLDPNSGLLTDLRNATSYATVGTPTWCVASGHTD